MKLTDSTKQILQNFSSINNRFMFRKGNRQATYSSNKALVAFATTDLEFPEEIGVTDLRKFNACISSIKDAEVEFFETKINIRNSSSEMTLAPINEQEVGRSVVDHKFDFTDALEVNVPKVVLAELRNYAKVMRLNTEKKHKSKKNITYDTIVLMGDGSNIYAQAQETKTYANETLRIRVSESSAVFKVVVLLSNLKLIDDDYTLCLKGDRVAKFVAKKHPIEYYVALEKI